MEINQSAVLPKMAATSEHSKKNKKSSESEVANECELPQVREEQQPPQTPVDAQDATNDSEEISNQPI